MRSLLIEQERIFMDEAKDWLHKPYLWGGQGQLSRGLDCSGLVTECARAAGLIGKDDDFSANGYWQMWGKDEIPRAKFGALAFWIDGTGRAYHVAICIGPFHCITADGGGSSTISVAIAEQKEAVIRRLPIEHGRKTRPRFVYIFD